MRSLPGGIVQGDCDDIVASQRGHLPEALRECEVGGQQPVARRKHAVVGGGRAAALQVAEGGHAGLEARDVLERLGEVLPHAAEAHVPEGVASAVEVASSPAPSSCVSGQPSLTTTIEKSLPRP